MKRENQDVVGDKCVRDDDGNMSLDDDSKKRAWEPHYRRLVNDEFPWDQDCLPHTDPVEGPPIYVTKNMVLEAIGKMKLGKAAGPTGIGT